MYTRVYAESSPRKLISGKGPSGQTLSRDELLNEFRRHSHRYDQEPTALVSVSSRIVDTVKRAFDKHYRDNEPATNVWVVFISEPAHSAGKGKVTHVHSAQDLAKACGNAHPGLFQYEHLFEWSIPESHVVHSVSLQTLMDRGLDWYKDIESIPALRDESTADLRARIAEDLWPIENAYGFWDVGICMGSFASLFGARAPINWIAYQLLYDCVKLIEVDDDDYRLEYYGHKRACFVDSSSLKCIDDGVDTVIIDWWFTGEAFVVDYQMYKDEQCEIEHSISEKVEEFNDIWSSEALSGRQKAVRDRAWSKLRDQIDSDRAALEKEAIRIGL